MQYIDIFLQYICHTLKTLHSTTACVLMEGITDLPLAAHGHPLTPPILPPYICTHDIIVAMKNVAQNGVSYIASRDSLKH